MSQGVRRLPAALPHFTSPAMIFVDMQLYTCQRYRADRCSCQQTRLTSGCDLLCHLQVKGNADELKDTAAKTGTQVADAAEQAAASADASTSQQGDAQGSASQGAGSRQAGEATGAEQEPGQAQGAGATGTAAAGAPNLMERLRTMASIVQKEVTQMPCLLLPQLPPVSEPSLHRMHCVRKKYTPGQLSRLASGGLLY